MKPVRLLLLAVLLLAAGVAAAGGGHRHGGHHGHRHHGHASVGLFIGAPLVPWYYYDYSPRVIVVPAPQPPVYVEQPPAPTRYWYYCRDSGGYYPRVLDCPGGWTPVLPR